jgi:mRNA interferase HigB
MRIIARKNLVLFWTKHPSAEAQLTAWFAAVKAAEWETPQDVVQHFPKASAIDENRFVFRKGNDYRLVVKINFAVGVIYICFVGTHQEYDSIDPLTVWKY